MISSTAFIGLGSNLGDRAAYLSAGLRDLGAGGQLEIVAVSAFIETDPEGPPGQGRYLNAAATVTTSLEPRALLETLLAIERSHGRRREDELRFGPRTLDMDLLMYGDAIIDEPGLTVPHPRMHERSFVLVPLAEIAPDVVHPGLKRTVEWLRQRLGIDTPRGVLE